jgi:hypothetical protein
MYCPSGPVSERLRAKAIMPPVGDQGETDGEGPRHADEEAPRTSVGGDGGDALRLENARRWPSCDQAMEPGQTQRGSRSVDEAMTRLCEPSGEPTHTETTATAKSYSGPVLREHPTGMCP